MYMYVELINKLLHVMHLLTKFDSIYFLFIPSSKTSINYPTEIMYHISVI